MGDVERSLTLQLDGKSGEFGGAGDKVVYSRKYRRELVASVGGGIGGCGESGHGRSGKGGERGQTVYPRFL